MIDLACRLREDIARLCLAADSLRGCPPGTAERGCYFHYWDSDLTYLTDIDALSSLRNDAAEFLREAIAEINLAA
jgi:hypothetical protein